MQWGDPTYALSALHMKIGKDTFATLSYTLRYDDGNGDIVEQISEEDPVEILMGHDLMLEILEKNLEGLESGDMFEFIIDPEQGYGDYDEEKVVTVPVSELMAEVPKEENVGFEEGDMIPITDMEGKEYQAVVLKKSGETVTLDFNHPLAGETLHFRGRVLMVRKASPEEIREAEAEDGGSGDVFAGGERA